MTLNQVITAIRHFGQSHGQLNTAEFRSASDWLQSEVVYPALFFDLVRVDKPVNMLSYVLRCYVVDVVTTEKHNEADVLSDAALILHDLISYMAQSNDIHTIAPSSFTPVTEATGDLVTGMFMDITVNVLAPNNKCAIPFKTDSIHTDDYTGVFS